MTERQLREVFEKTSGHCHFCGDPIDFLKRGWSGDLEGSWEVDHVIQKHKGGSSGIDNCLPACTRCNRLRWHRRGDQVRELLVLGLIAKDEIKRSSELGEKILKLQTKRLARNEARRLRQSGV